MGASSTTAAEWAGGRITTALAAEPRNHSIVLLNLGVNEFYSATEAQWKSDMQFIAAAVHTRWPDALIYITKPWKRDFDATADTFAGWIDSIVAGCSYCRVGDDERVWMKGADNGATQTYDGIHLTAAGNTSKTNQVMTLLGY